MNGTVVRMNLGEALKQCTKVQEGKDFRTTERQRENSRCYYQKHRELILFKRSRKVKRMTESLIWLWGISP